ncbi:ABC transporter permease [Dactylosporangium sp. McL0621]|uniref:ABC transporter permease n=1 Tax=Dactylosporangium sp. McL0621 TaxID=3415678 RepID=UPI003CEEF77F
MADDLRPVRLTPLDLLALGALGIRIRKVRAALSALGISIGIATMIVVTGIPASSERALMDQLTRLGTNLLQAVPAPQQNGEDTAFPAESVAMVGRIWPVTSVTAVANTHAVVRRSDLIDPRDGSGLTVLASRPDLLETLDATVRSGRFLDAVSTTFPTVVLGSVAAKRLGFPAVPPGPPPQVVIGNVWYSVIGILNPTPLSPDIDRSVLVGWDSARAWLGFEGRPTVIYVRAREPSIEAVRGVLPPTISPGRPSAVLVTRPSDALAAKRATEHTFSALFLGLALVALVVGGIGVANTMVISVLERRCEIGLRRALGASRGQIRGQFLTESVLLAGLGGVSGCVLGLAGTTAYALAHHWPVVIPALAVPAALGGAVVVGAVAGAYPSMRAARMTPTAALNSV